MRGNIRNVGAREDRKMQDTCIFFFPEAQSVNFLKAKGNVCRGVYNLTVIHSDNKT